MANSTSYLRHDISKLALNCRLKEVASEFKANKSTSFDADNKAQFDQLVFQGKISRSTCGCCIFPIRPTMNYCTL